MVGRHRPALIVLGYAMLTTIKLWRINLTDGSHTIEANWRESDARALEERIKAIDNWLDHTEDLAEMLGDSPLTTKLRSMSGLLKSQRNDLEAEAGKLRADLREP